MQVVPVPRMVGRAIVVALLATMLVPVGQVQVWATPLTLSETVDDLEPATPEDPQLAGSQPAAAGPEGPQRSAPYAPELTFSAVGFTTPHTATALRVRTSADGATWDAWEPVDFIDVDDGPDPGSVEARDELPGRHTEQVWVGEATHLQVEVIGADVDDVTVTVIDSMGHSGGPVQRQYDTDLGTAAEASALNVIPRAQWGADERITTGSVSVASAVHMGVVHHTAHTTNLSVANSYSQAEAAGLIRSMHRYHTVSLGWKDIGYNVLIDRFGNVYEGRKGGFERGVIGAHAANFNTGSFGVSVIGNFTSSQATPAAIDALTRVIGAKSAIHGIDPTGVTTRMGNGTARPTIVGHRDVGSTACPGRIRELLPQIRQTARTMAVRFPDVPSSSPHRAAILELAELGVTRGCEANAYCPAGQLNRAQAATFVVQALQLDPIAGSRFRDVPADGLHAASINVLAERGWLIGYPDGTYRPWEPLTRGQLATVLARALGEQLHQPGTAPYSDVPTTSTHAPGIAALQNVGVRGDCGSGRFCPLEVARRDSTASFVHMVRGVHAVRTGIGFSPEPVPAPVSDPLEERFPGRETDPTAL